VHRQKFYYWLADADEQRGTDSKLSTTRNLLKMKNDLLKGIGIKNGGIINGGTEAVPAAEVCDEGIVPAAPLVDDTPAVLDWGLVLVPDVITTVGIPGNQNKHSF